LLLGVILVVVVGTGAAIAGDDGKPHGRRH